MTVYAWPSLTPPEQFDFWIETLESVHGDENLTSSGVMEVVTRFARVRASVSWNNVSVPDALATEAHLARLRGRRHATTVPNLKYIAKLGTATGFWVVSGAFARGSESIDIASGSGTFSPGDWIEIEQITGVPRSYMVLAQTGAELEISPPLHEAVSSGKSVRHLGDGVTSRIRDTMEMVGDIGPATRYPAREPGIVGKRSLELVSSRRATFT
jgi:hypothetical protein